MRVADGEITASVNFSAGVLFTVVNMRVFCRNLQYYLYVREARLLGPKERKDSWGNGFWGNHFCGSGSGSLKYRWSSFTIF